MGEEIISNTPNPSPTLQSWCKAPITNIYLVTEKSCPNNKSYPAFAKVTPLLFTLDEDFYYKFWTGNIHETLEQIDFYEKMNWKNVRISEAFDVIDELVER